MLMSTSNNDLNASRDRRVTLHGKAENAKAGAVLITDHDGPVYIKGMTQWDSARYGKRIAIEGILRRGRVYPSPADAGGEVTQGIAGEQWYLEIDSAGGGR
jgi:hypothetical protein